ncbi:MAG TPA: type II toxin-antitoxin system VapC family toxin [Terriglobia bacterium]|nr:type II toxin-antitoxin system VapC family toxin [Terriglobia bacterium]
MTRLLLDTHIWLWSFLAPGHLSARVVNALKNPGHELWLSPISIWELVMLKEKGRVSLEKSVEEWVEEGMKKAGLREAPLTAAVALETIGVRLPHGDPADRFLVATARVFDLTLVTADKRLLATKNVSLLPNR